MLVASPDGERVGGAGVEVMRVDASADHPDYLLRVGLFFPEFWPHAEAWLVERDDYAPTVEAVLRHEDMGAVLEVGWRAWWELDDENSGGRDSRVAEIRERCLEWPGV